MHLLQMICQMIINSHNFPSSLHDSLIPVREIIQLKLTCYEFYVILDECRLLFAWAVGCHDTAALRNLNSSNWKIYYLKLAGRDSENLLKALSEYRDLFTTSLRFLLLRAEMKSPKLDETLFGDLGLLANDKTVIELSLRDRYFGYNKPSGEIRNFKMVTALSYLGVRIQTVSSFRNLRC